MSVSTTQRRAYSRKRRPAERRPRLEALEGRCLLSGPDNTLPLAQLHPLGDLNDPAAFPLHRTEVAGTISAAEVNWFAFSLGSASTVTLNTLDQAAGSPFVSTLSLYNADSDIGDEVNDTFDQFGYRLLARDDGANHGGDASLTRNLGAGTYFVAVSGSGNATFNPYVADSGFNGSTGAYDLLISANSLGIAATDGSVVLSYDPAAGSVTNQSPLVLRVDFSAALNPSTINTTLNDPGQDVHLYYWQPGQFGQGPGTEVPFASFVSLPPYGPFYFTDVGNELQLIPGQRLQPGTYQLVLDGDQSLHASAS